MRSHSVAFDMGCKLFSPARIVPAEPEEEVSPVVVFRKAPPKEEEKSVHYSKSFSTDDDAQVEFFDQQSWRTGLINYNGHYLLTRRNVSDSALLRPPSFSPLFDPVRIEHEDVASIDSDESEETRFHGSPVQKMLSVITTRLKSTASIFTEPDLQFGAYGSETSSSSSSTEGRVFTSARQ